MLRVFKPRSPMSVGAWTLAVFGAGSTAAVIAPGNQTRKAALVAAARPAVRMMYGAALMFLGAAFVEAFWSPITEVSFDVKVMVGIAAWVVLLSYLLLAGRTRAAR